MLTDDLLTRNVVVLSPKNGSFASHFTECGAAIRVGSLTSMLQDLRDISCVICNTIMTADLVLLLHTRGIPAIWILHEWWDNDMLTEQLEMRGLGHRLTIDIVRAALDIATHVVCVCDAQRSLYQPRANNSVIFVGVPDPLTRDSTQSSQTSSISKLPSITCSLSSLCSSQPSSYRSESDLELVIMSPLRSFTTSSPQLSWPARRFTILCLGIVCPRKNQLWAISLFQRFADTLSLTRIEVQLLIVGARRSRTYESEYLDKVISAASDDARISIYDVADDVQAFYNAADCLLLTSVNEVTPMVICEALSCSLPVLSTNIAGIKEMIDDGVEGYLFDINDDEKVSYLHCGC
jgi:glycosyltransferase involved in cell wall biosynthesis